MKEKGKAAQKKKAAGFKKAPSAKLTSSGEGARRRRAAVQAGMSAQSAALSQIECRFRAVFESSRDAIGVSKAGVHIFVNPAYLDLFGFPPDTDLAGRPVLDLIARESHDQIKEYIRRRVLGESVPSMYETRGLRTNGSAFDMEVNVSIYQEHGEDHTLVILRDITDRKRAEREIAERGAILQQIMDTASVAIGWVDKTGRITHANRRMAEMFGRTQEEIVGYEYVELIHPSERETGRKNMLALLASEIPYADVERLYWRKDGTEFWGHLACRRFHDAHGNERGLVGVITDIDSRKRAEEAVKESNNEFMSLADNISGHIAYVNADTLRYEFVNAMFVRSFGIPREKIIGSHIKDIIGEANYQFALKYINEVRSGKSISYENTFNLATGKRWIQVNYNPVNDASGHVVSIAVLSYDITERKQIEETQLFLLHCGSHPSGEDFFESLARYLAQSLGMDFVCIDRLLGDGLKARTVAVFHDGKFEDNVEYALKDTPCGDVVGKTICCFPRNVCRLFPKDTVLQDLMAESYVGTTLWSFEGKPIGLIAVIGRSPLVNTSLAESVLNLVSISAARELERRESEEVLRESEAKYRNLFESSTDGIFIIDVDGNFIDVNTTAHTRLGYTKDEMLALHISKLDDQKFARLVPERLTEIRKHGFDVFESVHLRKDGTAMPVEVNSRLLEYEGRTVYFSVIRDITERVMAEKELLKTQKLESLGILAGGIAHDFNNLLTAILGSISLVRMKMNADDPLAQLLADAEKASFHAKDLTQQLLTFARGGAPIKTTVSTEQLIRDSAAFALRGSNVKCFFSFTEKLWLLELDEGQMMQAFNNILLNACQAMPGGGRIRIEADNVDIGAKNSLPLAEGKYVRISIKDHGTGIAEEHLQKIFDPYFTTKQKGSGLGLAITHSIIGNHNGCITVQSKLGAGTTFTICLPASGKRNVHTKSAEQDCVAGAGRVLVMDDEEMVRKIAGEMLRGIGYQVEVASDGAEAVRLYKIAMESSQPFNAVIMDLTVPGGIGGKEAMKLLRALDPNAKAIVSSGYANDPVMSDFKSYGFVSVITKPYRISDLSRALRDILKG